MSAERDPDSRSIIVIQSVVKRRIVAVVPIFLGGVRPPARGRPALAEIGTRSKPDRVLIQSGEKQTITTTIAKVASPSGPVAFHAIVIPPVTFLLLK
jgi:hypothetical protein